MENYIQYIIAGLIVLVVAFVSYRLYKKRNGDFTGENPAHPSGGGTGTGEGSSNEEIIRDDFSGREGNSLVDQHRRRNNR